MMNNEMTRSGSTKGHLPFDERGRLVPQKDSVVYSQSSRNYFTLLQPEINFAATHAKIEKHLKKSTGVSAAEFESTCTRILENLGKDERTKNLLNAVRIPFLCLASTADYGKELDETYLEGMGGAFKEHFPEYTFTNYYAGKLAGDISVVPGSRYERLMDKRAKGPVIGWYFPNALSEYSIPSQRASIANLPEPLILSGGIEAASAMIGAPELLVKKDELYPPLLCLSAIQPKEDKFFYHFEAYGWNVTFNRRSYLGAVAEYWAGGITVIA